MFPVTPWWSRRLHLLVIGAFLLNLLPPSLPVAARAPQPAAPKLAFPYPETFAELQPPFDELAAAAPVTKPNLITVAAPLAQTTTISLTLQNGWNLIALPLTPATATPVTVFATIAGSYDLVYGYDGCAASNPWKKYNPGGPPFANTLTTLTVAQGLWIRALGATTLTLQGAPPANTMLALCQGWNLISYPTANAVPIATALAGIAGKYDLIYGYNASNTANPWQKYNPTGPPFANTLSQLQAGRGYWLRATTATTLTVQSGPPPTATPTATPTSTPTDVATSTPTNTPTNTPTLTPTPTIQNTLPTLSPIGNQTVAVGSKLNFTLAASDADQDGITFLVAPVPLPAGATLNQTTGAFEFKPDGTQVGAIQLTFTAMDARGGEDSETVTITVQEPPANQPTTLTGRVLDTNDYTNGVERPVVGATIALLDTTFATQTDANGYFTLAGVPAGVQVLDIDTHTALPAPGGSPYSGFRERLELLDGANNVINRPFFLPRLAAESLTTVNPAQTTTVENPTLDIQMEVAPFSAQAGDGTDFTGQLSISPVPEALAPAALPEELDPGLLITIQPVGVTFDPPAAITFPNTDNLPPGTEVDIWSLDAKQGIFVVVAKGRVSADGQIIETISGGIRAADWHMALPPQPDNNGDDNNNDNQNPDNCCNVSSGSETDVIQGNLSIDHELVNYQSLGIARGVHLVYNSMRADPRPIINSNVTISQRSAIPQTVSTRLRVAGIDVGEEVHWDTSTLPDDLLDKTVRTVTQFDATDFATGLYSYRLRLISNYAASSVASTQNGRVLVNNMLDSPFGAGWGIDGLQHIHEVGDGDLLITDGNGGATLFVRQRAANELIAAKATVGIPADSTQASANVGQAITFFSSEPIFDANSFVTFTTLDDSGNRGTRAVQAAAVAETGDAIAVMVPNDATSGPVFAEVGREVFLQIVPTLSHFQNDSFQPESYFYLQGTGFAEGDSKLFFGATEAPDSGTNSGHDIYGANTQLYSYLPENPGSVLTLRTTGGTSNPLPVGPGLITGLKTVAAAGTPAAADQASANIDQAIIISGTNLGTNTVVRFPSVNDEGQVGTVTARVSHVAVDGQSATVRVPYLATTGDVTLVGGNGAAHLQIVPTLGSASVGDFAPSGANRNLSLYGAGYAEGATTIHFGTATVTDPNAGPETIDIYSNATIANTTIPANAGGLVTVSTAGGTSNALLVGPSAFTGIQATATTGTSANAAQASANVGQLITILGTNLGTNTNVTFPTVDDNGVASSVTVRVNSVGADGSWANVTVPTGAVTGNIAVFGATGSLPLQIVPYLGSFSLNDFVPSGTSRNLTFYGHGYREGGTTLHFGAVPVADPNTGPETIDVYSSGTALNTIIPANASGLVTISTAGGTSNALAVGPSAFTALQATAKVGTPADAAQASANVGQVITLLGTALGSTTNVTFPTLDDNGVAGSVTVRVSSVGADGSWANVTVPNSAVTGNLSVFGAAGTSRLQIVPHLTGYSNSDFRPTGTSRELYVDGGGFLEGNITLHFGSGTVTDPNTGPTTVDVYASGTRLDTVIPTSPGSQLSVTTPGGTSNVLTVGPTSFTGLQTTAALGTPANAGQPSANVGQEITLLGTNLRPNTNVLFPTRDDIGVAGTALVRVSYAAPDGTVAAVVVPPGVTSGNISVVGASGAFALQIVPHLNAFTNYDFSPSGTSQNLTLYGGGFKEGAMTVQFGATNVVDPNTGSTTLDVYSSGTGLNVVIPNNPGGLVAVVTDGGTSNDLTVGPTAYTGIQATANLGTPANAAQPSANVNQALTILGANWGPNTNVVFPTKNDIGVAGTTIVRVTYVSADRTQATVTVPQGAVTGNVTVQGVSGSFALQIVPTINWFSPPAFTAGNTLPLYGDGFVEGALTVKFGATNVVDPNTGSTTIDVYSSGTALYVTIPASPNPLVSVVTAGGTSNVVSVNGAPAVTLLAPKAGDDVVENRPFTIRALALDDNAIQAVTFLVDGVVVETDENTPYEVAFTAPAFDPAHRTLTLSARATDGNNNTVTATNVIVDLVQPTLTISATAAFGTPAVAGQPAANTGQAITIGSVGLTPDSEVVFPTIDTEGTPGTLPVRVSSVNADGTAATVIVPDSAVTGDLTLAASDATSRLQIVPRLTGFTNYDFRPSALSQELYLHGGGFVEGDMTVTFGATAVVDPGTTPETLDVYGNNLSVIIPNNPGGAVSVTTAGGTSNSLWIGPSAFTGMTAIANTGTPANGALPSANGGQYITILGADLGANTVVRFPTLDPEGAPGQTLVRVTDVSADHTAATVLVPYEAVTGDLTVYGATGSFPLQIVPRLITFNNGDFYSNETAQYLTLNGSGFVEGATTIHFGAVDLTDPDTGNVTLDVYGSGTALNTIIPVAAGGLISVTTPGGTSNALTVGPTTFTAIEAIAGVGVAANPGQPAANSGQAITLRGADLGPNTNVIFSTVTDIGVAETTVVRVSSVSADRTAATVVVPNGAVTGDVRLFGAAGAWPLQIVPRLNGFSNSDFAAGNYLYLDGAGFVEGAITVHFGATDLSDPDTGENTLEVYSAGTRLYTQIPVDAGGLISVTTAGGTSNALSVGPQSFTGLTAHAHSGTPAVAAQPSANVGQLITLQGRGLGINTIVSFPTMNDVGVAESTTVRVSSVSADHTLATVAVPNGAVTGDLQIVGLTATQPLQIVPLLTHFTNDAFVDGGYLYLDGAGFIEGATTMHFGATDFSDPDAGENTFDVYWSGTRLGVQIPVNAGGLVAVTTDGGTSNALSVGPQGFTGLVGTAESGAPADAAQPSANVGQPITIRGVGLGSNTHVTFPTRNDEGVVGTTTVRVSGANADGTAATVVVPQSAFTGDVMINGIAGAFRLQIVPKINTFNLFGGGLVAGNTLRLEGSGFTEGDFEVRFGNVVVNDPDNGPNTVDVFWSGTGLNVTVPTNPGANVRVVTAGGVSNLVDVDPDPVALLAPAPDPDLTGGTDGPRSFRAPDGDFSTVTENADGTFTRRMKDGVRYTYSAAGLMTSEIDRNDNTTTYSYDAAGRLTRITDPVALQTNFTYANGRLTSITDPAGRATNFQHDAQGNLIRITDPDASARQFGYDGRHHIVFQSSKRSFITQYQYNFAGMHVKSIWPDGSTRLIAPSNLVGLVDTSTGLGTRSNPAPVTRPTDVRGTFTDGEGRVTTYGLNRLGSATVVTGPDGLSTQMTRDDDGNVVSTTRPSGNIYNRTYDANGNLLTMQDSAVNGTTRYAYDPTFNLVTGITDSFNQVTTIQRDSHGNLTQISSPLGRAVAYSYNSRGLPTTLTDPLGTNTAYIYNSLGLLTSTSQGSGAAQRALAYTYTPAGYTASLTDPLSRAFGFTYDAAGRLTSESLPGSRTVTYQYNVDGDITGITPPGRPQHTFEYNSIGLLTAYIPPTVAGSGTTRTTYEYNRSQQVTKITRPDGQTIAYGYDNAGHMSTLTSPRGNYSYGYSATTSQLTALNAPGNVNLAYGYTGELLTSATWSGAVAGSVTYAYDANYRTTSVAVNGSAITYQYDADDALTRAGDLQLTYNGDSGLLTGSTLGTVSDSYTHNAFAELSAYSASAGGNPLYNTSYTRDKLGRITAKSETIGGATTVYSYTYDVAGRLSQVQANGATAAAYTYDANGNRLSFTNGSGTTVNGAYDNQDRLLQYGTTTYSYTANGELLSKTNGGQTTNYTYDVFGNLIAVTLPNGTQIDYLVDGQQRRVGKRVGGTLVQGWLYQDELKPLAELDGSGNVVSRFIYGSRVNVPDFMIKGGVTYRLVVDHLGSVRLVINTQTGALAQRLDYDAFGRVTQDTNPKFQPFGFAGGLYDADTGLVRFGARDYDAEVGRWTTKDTAGFLGGDTNLYLYAGYDPLNFIDTDGEWVWVAAGAVMGAGINVALTYAANGGNVTGRQLAAAAVSGAVSGAVGALAGPLGGTIAKGLGASATGLVSAGLNAGISAAGGGLGQGLANAIDPCNASSIGNAALFAGLGGALASQFPVRGMSTLKQASYFAPRTVPGLVRTGNARWFAGSLGVSAAVGGVANFGGPF